MAINQYDKEYMYLHLRAYIAHTVPDDLHDLFEIYAIKEIETDPEYWFNADWTRMYNSFLAKYYES